MLTAVTIVSWSVCLCVGRERKLCCNGGSDLSADWGVDLWEPKEQCIRWGPGSSHGKGHFWGSKLREYFSGYFTKAREFISDAFDIFYLPTS